MSEIKILHSFACGSLFLIVVCCDMNRQPLGNTSEKFPLGFHTLCHRTRQTMFSSSFASYYYIGLDVSSQAIRMFICLTYMQNEPQACVWMEICSPRADNLGGMIGCHPIWAVYKQLYEISALTAFKMCLKEWQNVCVCLLSFALKLYSPEYISLISHHSFHPQMRCVRCWAEGEFPYWGYLTKQLCHFSLIFPPQTLRFIIECTKFPNFS